MNFWVNDRVLANWTQDEFWYPATITEVEGERFYVEFDDGDKEWITSDRLMSINIEVGARVYAKWQAGEEYYPGKVTEKNGEDIYVVYDDGDEEWTMISYVRVTR